MTFEPSEETVRFHRRYEILRTRPALCAACSIYYAIKWADPGYDGPLPPCNEPKRCLQLAREKVKAAKYQK